jgi:hypothetical protein
VNIEGKKIVYKSRSIYLGITIIAWGFTIVGIVSHYWTGAIFFGALSLYAIYPFLNPKIKVVWIGSKEFDEVIKAESERRYNDEGIFKYHDDGFTVQLQKSEEFVKWNDIQTLIAYKVDNYSTDTIYLDVFCSNNNSYRFTEEHKGWNQFLLHLYRQFPKIDRKWEVEIISPAFEASHILLLDKKGRTLEEAIKAYYKEKPE